jgi:5-methylcytosine-specific restriction endonuclease McrA
MRRKSKNPRRKAQEEADTALQNYFRRNFPDKKCEACGAPFQVMHHHIEKSKSNAGRYYHDNLIFLCNACHSRIHFQDHNVVATYSARRGEKWVKRMGELKRIQRPPYTIKELLVIKEVYDNDTPLQESLQI